MKTLMFDIMIQNNNVSLNALHIRGSHKSCFDMCSILLSTISFGHSAKHDVFPRGVAMFLSF